MPLQQRVIEPVNVSRSTLPLPPGDIKPLIKTIAAATGQGIAANAAAAVNINIVNELECVTNGTLANLIRQLSSLSRQAEELLTGVFDDASKLLTRTIGLQQRMDALAVKVEAIDQPNDASITLRDPANQRETFSSDLSCDQQVLSKQKMPSSIAELYQTCDKPPPLNKLDPYRNDGKDGLKFYTDPTYFFELWKKDMMKQQQQNQPPPKTEALAPPPQAPQKFTQLANTQYQHQYEPPKPQQQMNNQHHQYSTSPIQVPQDEVRVQQAAQPQHPQGPIASQQPGFQLYQQSLMADQKPLQQQQQQQQYEVLQKQSTNQGIQQYQRAPYIQNVHQQVANQQHTLMTPPPPPPALSPLPPPSSPPPPPPPPAPPAPVVAQPPPILQPPTAAQLQQKQQELRKTVPIQRDPRSDLLAAIKQGITLRRVEDSKRRVEAEKQQSMGNDVASILARRVAMQVSDSDESGADDDEDNDWDDSSNR